jgi:hypothetical protein
MLALATVDERLFEAGVEGGPDLERMSGAPIARVQL